MARGQQKIQAQQKNAAKQQKGKGKSTPGQHAAKASKALKITCEACKVSMLNAKMLKDHWDAKHPKLPYPKELNEA